MSKKWIGILLIITGLGYLGICLFSPSNFNEEKSIQINASFPVVYLSINDVKEWPKWYSWNKEDPDLKFSLGGRETNIGANFTFDGPVFGKGYIEIKESFKDSLLTYTTINSRLPNSLISNWRILPESGKFVYVKHLVRMSEPIPFLKRPFYRGLQKQLENRVEEDLKGLKNYIEQLVQSEFGIKREFIKERYYVGIKEPVVNNRIPSFYARAYPKIYHLLDSLKVPFTGPPVGLVYGWNGENNYVFLMAALPVERKIDPGIGFFCEKISTGQCLKLEHYGSYNTLRNAHVKLDYTIRNSQFILDVPIIEEYVTSPSQEPDTSKWLTNIYYLLNTEGGFSKSLQKQRTQEDIIKEQEAKRKRELEEFNKQNKQ